MPDYPLQSLKAAMTDKLIPPSPSADEYAEAHMAHEAEIEAGEPFVLFAEWLKDAKAKEPNDPNAMAVATVDADGLPDVRMVLLKDFDEAGFVFYTNALSAKGQQLTQDPKAALLFHWKSLRRQVRIRGGVSRVSDAEADAYFHSRARQSQIGAWASDQSRPLEDRFALEKRSQNTASNSVWVRSTVRHTGPVSASRHWLWNSGATGLSACMTVCSSAGIRSRVAGRARSFIPDHQLAGSV